MSSTEPSAVNGRPTPSGNGPAAFPRLSPDDFRGDFGEELAAVLNVDNWHAGRDLDEEYRRIDAEVRQSVEWETDIQRRVRDEVLPKLAWADGAPKCAGRGEVTPAEMREVSERLLFPGGVEACDGTCQVHDTLPLTIYQVGVSLVSYAGDHGTWSQRLFRRDLRQRHEDPVEEALELLNRRGRRAAQNHDSPKDGLSQLARRAVMSYAERAVLARKSSAIWRMGHGAPAEYQLLSAGGYADLMILSVRLLRELIEGHPKFVFVSSEPADRLLLTVGEALRPLEFAVVSTLAERMADYLENLTFGQQVTVDDRWDSTRLTPEEWVLRFRDALAAKVVVGVYRATLLGPAHVFYAHEDHAADAARIAIADSALQEQRGFPLLIDLAHTVCNSVYAGGSLREMADAAYAAAGMPFRYHSERMMRED